MISFHGTMFDAPVAGSVADDGTLTADGPAARALLSRVGALTAKGVYVGWANHSGPASTRSVPMAIATLEMALDEGSAKFAGVELDDEMEAQADLAEAFGLSPRELAQKAEQEFRVGAGHATGGQFSKKAVPAIGKGGKQGENLAVGKGGRPSVASAIGKEHPALALFTPEGKTIFGHSLPQGLRVAKPEERKASKVPPGYPLAMVPEEPWENGVVGVGVDTKGRVKRFYSDEANAERAKKKFVRVRMLSKKLGKLDRQLGKDAPTDDVAAVVALVRATGLRPGSESETGGAKKAFGATTLLASHLTIRDDGTIVFDFVGKNGKSIRFPVADPKLAEALRPHWEGKGPDEQVFADVNERKINRYLKGVLGDEYKIKDLRTVLATTAAQSAVESLAAPPTGKRAAQQLRLAIAKQISDRLGNTPTEVINSYVDPGVWNAIGL